MHFITTKRWYNQQTYQKELTQILNWVLLNTII